MIKKNIIKNFKKNQLISGSFVLFLGTMVANFGGYLYHFLMGRMLGPSDYGVLASLISLNYIFSILTLTFSTTTVKFLTLYKAKKQWRKIYSLFTGLIKIFGLAGVIIFIFFLSGRKLIGNFLHFQEEITLKILGLWLAFSFPIFVNNAFLLGFLKFGFLSFNNILGTILKVGLAIILVKLDFRVNGAIGSIFLSSLFSYFFSFYPLRFLWQYKNGEKIEWSGFFKFSLPVTGAILGLTSLYSADIILVRHFFPSLEAGLYSALAFLGKIVYFASSVVPTVMFPLISERFENGKNYRFFLNQSLLIVGVVSFLITGIYFLFPKLMILILYGESYLGVSPYLGMFGLFISFYSLVNLLVNFFLSIKKTFVAIFSLVGASAQIILIYFWHNSLLQVIIISLVISILLFLVLMIFLRQSEKRKISFFVSCSSCL